MATTAPHRLAVTLIELLVVISIMGLLAGMIMSYDWVDREEAALNQAAVELRSTIRKARALAMREGKTYAITFHIESPGDGKVIRNFAAADPAEFRGRHWYAIVGPVSKDDTRGYADLWVPPGVDTTIGADTLASFRQKVAEHLVGPRHYLPRTVRFLALSDLDGAADRSYNDRFKGDFGSWGRDRYGQVYPVPWFGAIVPKGDGFRLLPWGFYDDQIARYGVVDTSGWQGEFCGTRSAFGAGEDNPGFQQGGTTTLAEGLTMDAHLRFNPDGRIEWKHTYYDKRKLLWSPTGMAREWTSIQRSEITGGFHLTLARDVDQTEPIYRNGALDEFVSQRDALQSITPFVRVFVHERSGQTDIRHGLPKAPKELDWTKADGTLRSASEMGSMWQGLHPFCRVQQLQKLYNKGAGDTASPRAYHLDDNPFVHFKPAASW